MESLLSIDEQRWLYLPHPSESVSGKTTEYNKPEKYYLCHINCKHLHYDRCNKEWECHRWGVPDNYLKSNGGVLPIKNERCDHIAK